MTTLLNIKKTRETVGISQKELAKKTNISQVYLSYIENGHREPSLLTLRKIATILNVPVTVLISDNKPTGTFS